MSPAPRQFKPNSKMEEKTSSEILDEMFRELEEKSAKGELKKSDFSTVLVNTLVTDEQIDRGSKRKSKHKHSKHKSKKSKKHKSKSKHSSESANLNEASNPKATSDLPSEVSTNKNKENCPSEDENGNLEEGEIPNENDGKLKISAENSKKSSKKRSKSTHNDSKRDKSKHKKHVKSGSNINEKSSSRERSSVHKRNHSRSNSRDRSSSYRKKSHTSTGSHRRSKSTEKSTSNNNNDDDKIDKAKLLEIARKNALSMLSQGRLPKILGSDKLKSEQIVSIRAGGKSVEELTDFCKLLSDKEKEEIRHRNYLSDDDRDLPPQSDEDDKSAPFIHHPFKLKDPPAPIIMKIKSAIQLPTKTHAEKVADTVKLRLQFPVSSGSQHRTKEWVPVNPKAEKEKNKPKAITQHEETPAPPPVEDKVFIDPQIQPKVDIGSIVSDRLKAIRALNDNPHDVQALGLMYRSQQQMQTWAESKQLPGQFTGSTGVQILTPHELAGPSNMQAWVRKAVVGYHIFPGLFQFAIAGVCLAALQQDFFRFNPMFRAAIIFVGV